MINNNFGNLLGKSNIGNGSRNIFQLDKDLESLETRIEEFLKNMLEYFTKMNTSLIEWKKGVDNRFSDDNQKIRNYMQVIKSDFNRQLKSLLKSQDEKIEDKVFRENIYTSRSVKMLGEMVQGDVILRKALGTGRITQFLLKSIDKNFSISVVIDGEPFFTEDYQYFFTHGDFLENVAAFKRDSFYYLSVKDIYFQKGFSASIKSPEAAVFDQILLTYVIKNEIEV